MRSLSKGGNYLRVCLKLFLGLLTVAPFLSGFSFLSHWDTELWSHLIEFKVTSALWTTLVVVLGSTLGSLLIGILLSIGLAFYRWPLQRLLITLILLPLAIPPYVISFLWSDFFIRNNLYAWDIRSPSGAIAVFSLSLYPYVFILCYSAFKSIRPSWIETASLAGMNTLRTWTHVVLPLSKPWILSAIILVSFEVISDFGAVSQLGVETLSILIYRTWAGLQDFKTAVQLALGLSIISILMLYFKSKSEKKMASYQHQFKRELKEKPPTLLVKLFFSIGFTLFILVSSIFPIYQLLALSLVSQTSTSIAAITTIKSLGIALGVAVLAVLVSGFFVSLSHLARLKLSTWDRFHLILYGMPGTLMGVLLLGSLSYIPQSNLFEQFAGVILILALFMKFNGVALSQIESGEERISYSLDETAALLKLTTLQRSILFFRNNRISFVGAFLFVFIECLREMPLTIMTRPIGWETLSVKIYQYTSEGLWAEAAPFALFLVVIGLSFSFYMTRNITYERSSS